VIYAGHSLIFLFTAAQAIQIAQLLLMFLISSVQGKKPDLSDRSSGNALFLRAVFLLKFLAHQRRPIGILLLREVRCRYCDSGLRSAVPQLWLGSAKCSAATVTRDWEVRCGYCDSGPRSAVPLLWLGSAKCGAATVTRVREVRCRYRDSGLRSAVPLLWLGSAKLLFPNPILKETFHFFPSPGQIISNWRSMF